MTKGIPLTKDAVVLVDDQDFEWLMQWKWHLHPKGYAARHRSLKTGPRKTLLMHREILKATDSELVDHRNRNKLDNQRSNLRRSTKQGNNTNRSPQSNNASGYKGVVWDKARNKWVAYITVNSRQKNLGGFVYITDAARAYDKAAKAAFGEFAGLNFPDT